MWLDVLPHASLTVHHCFLTRYLTVTEKIASVLTAMFQVNLAEPVPLSDFPPPLVLEQNLWE